MPPPSYVVVYVPRWLYMLAEDLVIVVLSTLGVALAGACGWFVTSGVWLEGCSHDANGILLKKVEEGLVMYAARHKGRFPDRLEEAAPYFPEGVVPRDAWGNEILYVVQEGPYVLVSLGADGKVGGMHADADRRSDQPE